MKTPNRHNSDFQILYNIVGACHTPDAAYALLIAQYDERMMAVAEFELHANAPWYIKLFRPRKSQFAKDLEQRAYQAAKREVAFIRQLIERVKPHRKFAHMPEHQAHEMAMLEETRLELIYRAENYLISEGRIPHNQLDAMRQHPEFKESIWPQVLRIGDELKQGKLPNFSSRPNSQLLEDVKK